jgi:hypothetical protein
MIPIMVWIVGNCAIHYISLLGHPFNKLKNRYKKMAPLNELFQ